MAENKPVLHDRFRGVSAMCTICGTLLRVAPTLWPPICRTCAAWSRVGRLLSDLSSAISEARR
jgi:hypothetical protein